MATHLLVGPHPSWDCDWSCHLFLRPIRSSLTSFVYEYNPPPPPPTMLFLGAGVQLPACSWESSPGPRRRSCPLHCGMWLWNPHSWWHCLDWASTGDTWPTNKQIILFTVQCMLDNHKYMHFIYWTIAISYAPCFWHFGDPFSPEQHSCSYNRFSCGLTVCILLYVW